jgi:hypothetical protein
MDAKHSVGINEDNLVIVAEIVYRLFRLKKVLTEKAGELVCIIMDSW